MHRIQKIPRINRIAVLVIIAFSLNFLFATLSPHFLSRLLSMQEFANYTLNTSAWTLLSSAVRSLVNIILAVWIFKQARKLKEEPWTWAMLAIIFGLLSVIAFYLLLAVRELQVLNKKMSMKTKDVE
jgi:hypothetical protein